MKQQSVDTPEPNGETWSCAAFFGGQSGFTCLGFRWQNDVMTRLLPLAGGNNSFATGANNDGRVVGDATANSRLWALKVPAADFAHFHVCERGQGWIKLEESESQTRDSIHIN